MYGLVGILGMAEHKCSMSPWNGLHLADTQYPAQVMEGTSNLQIF